MAEPDDAEKKRRMAALMMEMGTPHWVRRPHQPSDDEPNERERALMMELGTPHWIAQLRRLSIIQGDITTLEVDAIVNAANNSLLGGGGVDGAIHHAAGPELLAECRTLKCCATGDAKLTGGYNLPARYVIHTVGPVYADGKQGEREALQSCYRRCLALAEQHELRSIAFPAISAGAYGYPPKQAAGIAVAETGSFLRGNRSIEQITLVAFDRPAYDTYLAAVRGRWGEVGLQFVKAEQPE